MTSPPRAWLLATTVATSPWACSRDAELNDATEGLAEGSSSDSVSSVESTVDPSGDPTTEPTGTMTMSATETQSATVTATDSGPTTGGACVTSDECTDPLNPICENMVCVPCTDAPVPDDACAEKGAGTPVCRDDGACVACTPANAGACEGTTPVCDGATNECEGCDFHEQCPGTACEIATGACFSEEFVVEVDGDGGAEYESIQDAIMDGYVVIVHEAATPYFESVEIDGLVVAVLAADGEEPVVQGNGGPGLAVLGGASAYVQDLEFRNSPVEGVAADGATVWLDRSRIVGNAGGGVVLSGGADGQLRTTFVRGDDGYAAVTSTASTADILYSTLVGVLDTSPALTCDAGATVRNSIVVSRANGGDPDVDCPATITYSALELAYPGEGNVAVGALLSGNQDVWFTSYADGDFTLNNPPAAVLTAAEWRTGDPPTDIQGAPRPAVDGSPDAAGADLP